VAACDIKEFSLAFIFDYFVLVPFMLFAAVLYRNISLDSQNRQGSCFFYPRIFALWLSWYFIFPAHSLAHTYILFLVRHLVPAAA